MSDIFGTTGTYPTSTIHIQTLDGMTTALFDRSGAQGAHYVPVGDEDPLNGIATGDRFILAVSVPLAHTGVPDPLNFGAALSAATGETATSEAAGDASPVAYAITLTEATGTATPALADGTPRPLDLHTPARRHRSAPEPLFARTGDATPTTYTALSLTEADRGTWRGLGPHRERLKPQRGGEPHRRDRHTQRGTRPDR